MSNVRYSVQRFGSWEWLDFDLPIDTDGPAFTFSSYEKLSGTISPEIGNRLAEDGSPVLEKWGSLIHVETPDERVWTGIVEDVSADGATLTVVAREWVGYLHDLTFTGNIVGVEADPADLARELFAHVQSHPGARLGVTVTGSTPVRVGTDWENVVAYLKANLDELKRALDQALRPLRDIEDRIKTISAKHDKLIDPKARELKPYERAYRLEVRAKEKDTGLAAKKNAVQQQRDGKAQDQAIVAYKTIAAAKSADDDLRTKKWALDDETDLKNADAQLQTLKEAYDWQREHKAPAATVAAAKKAYDARAKYWTDRLAPLKAAYEARRDFFDNRMKPLKRNHDIRTIYWDALITQADNAYKRAVEAWDERLKPSKYAVDSRQAVLEKLREAKEDELWTPKLQLDDEREADRGARFEAEIEQAEAKLKVVEAALKEDGGAWKARAEDSLDCWKILMDLAAVAPFDFTTKTERTNGAPKLTLQLHYPRVGRTREDLVFEQGVNIVEQPEVEVPEDYASEVIALGAGEGSGDDARVLRATVATSDARLYRNAVYSDPGITQLATLQAAGRAELARLRAPVVVPEIVVMDHPNCPVGAWAAGDTITVKLHSVPHFGRVVVKHRVRSWQRLGTHKARLFLEAV